MLKNTIQIKNTKYWLHEYMHLYKKKINAKTYSFLVIDTTLASDNHLLFRMNLSERIRKQIMTIY